jgi:hypothetical protein
MAYITPSINSPVSVADIAKRSRAVYFVSAANEAGYGLDESSWATLLENAALGDQANWEMVTRITTDAYQKLSGSDKQKWDNAELQTYSPGFFEGTTLGQLVSNPIDNAMTGYQNVIDSASAAAGKAAAKQAGEDAGDIANKVLIVVVVIAIAVAYFYWR